MSAKYGVLPPLSLFVSRKWRIIDMFQMSEAGNWRKPYVWLLLNGLGLLYFVRIGYHSFYDLFVFEPGVNYPWVELSQTVWGKTVVHFIVNVPTVTRFLIFVIAVLGIVSGLFLFVFTFLGEAKKVQAWWRMLVILLLASVICYMVQLFDFFSNAFDGVG
ncbi:MAG: hypothetical protein WAS33_27995, partial [Candidatus Promineifilaceae bacterium]